MKPVLLVLAAGIGSRYGGLKQIDPVGPNGEIILDYSIYDAMQAGFERLVFVIRKDIEKDFKAAIGEKTEKKIETDYVFQNLKYLPDNFICPSDRAKPWGTGHAILSAKNTIKQPFAVVNADDFYGRSGYALLADALKDEEPKSGTSEYFMVGYTLRNTLSEHGYVSRGVCRYSADSLLIDVVERTKIRKEANLIKYVDENAKEQTLSGDEIVSMNMWGFSPSIFRDLEEEFGSFLKGSIDNPKSEFFIPTAVANLINAGKAKVKMLRSKDQWFGVTYREDRDLVIRKVKKLIEEGLYPEYLS